MTNPDGDGGGGVARPEFPSIGLRAFRSGVRRSYWGYESKNLCTLRGVLVPLPAAVSSMSLSIESERMLAASGLDLGVGSRARGAPCPFTPACASGDAKPSKLNHWIDVFWQPK